MSWINWNSTCAFNFALKREPFQILLKYYQSERWKLRQYKLSWASCSWACRLKLIITRQYSYIQLIKPSTGFILNFLLTSWAQAILCSICVSSIELCNIKICHCTRSPKCGEGVAKVGPLFCGPKPTLCMVILSFICLKACPARLNLGGSDIKVYSVTLHQKSKIMF